MLNIGVLASHEGSTLQAVLDACASGEIAGRVAAVISNNGASGALLRAKNAGVASYHLSSVTHPTPADLDTAICVALSDTRCDVVLLAGYLKRVGPATLAAFRGRVLNTHPALLPRFGGQGMFGDRVHEAALASGDTESGVSVHLVDAEYDTGDVIRHGRVPIEPSDTVASLQARVRACERKVVVETLGAIATGELRLPRHLC